MEVKEKVNFEKLPFWKRTLIVDKKLQFAFAVYSVSLALIGILLNVLFQKVMISRMHSEEPLDFTSIFLGNLSVLTVFFLLFFVMIFAGFVLSNRVAGPLFRMRNHMEAVASGQTIEKIIFRERDYCTEVAESYNKVLDRLKEAKRTEKG